MNQVCEQISLQFLTVVAEAKLPHWVEVYQAAGRADSTQQVQGEIEELFSAAAQVCLLLCKRLSHFVKLACQLTQLIARCLSQPCIQVTACKARRSDLYR